MDNNKIFPLEKVKSMVDLGVRFDTNLMFRDHISEKINKAYSILVGTVENHENTEAVFFVFFVSCRVFRVFLQLPCFAVFFLQFCWPFNSFAQFLNNKLIIVFLYCYLRLLSLLTTVGVTQSFPVVCLVFELFTLI